MMKAIIRIVLLLQLPVLIAALPFALVWIGLPALWEEMKVWPGEWIREWNRE